MPKKAKKERKDSLVQKRKTQNKRRAQDILKYDAVKIHPLDAALVSFFIPSALARHEGDACVNQDAGTNLMPQKNGSASKVGLRYADLLMLDKYQIARLTANCNESGMGNTCHLELPSHQSRSDLDGGVDVFPANPRRSPQAYCLAAQF